MNRVSKFPSDSYLMSVDFTDVLMAGEYVLPGTGITIIDENNIDTTTSMITDINTVDAKRTFRLQNGDLNMSYKLYVKVDTSFGNKYEMGLAVDVAETYDFRFSKFDYEKFDIAVDFVKVLSIGETIISQTILAFDENGTDVTSDVISASEIYTTNVLVVVKDGVVGMSCRIQAAAYTSLGNTYVGEFIMDVVDI